MKNLWIYIEKQNWHAVTKYRVALLIFGTLYALAGLAVWLIIRIWALSTWDWMVCFIMYPVVISWFVAFKHDFHDGNAADNEA